MADDPYQESHSFLDIDTADGYSLTLDSSRLSSFDSFFLEPHPPSTPSSQVVAKNEPAPTVSSHPVDPFARLSRHQRYRSQSSNQTSTSSVRSSGTPSPPRHSPALLQPLTHPSGSRLSLPNMADFCMDDTSSPGQHPSDLFADMNESPYLHELDDQSNLLGNGLDFGSNDDPSSMGGGIFGNRNAGFTAVNALNHQSAGVHGNSSSFKMSESPVRAARLPSSLGASTNDAFQMSSTVQPNKMFQLGSGDESPNSPSFLNSNEGSPAPFSTNSPMATNATDGFTSAPQANYSNVGLQFDRSAPKQSYVGQALPDTSDPNRGGTAYPCGLTIDPTPEKSRVETQIPIKLTLTNAPPRAKKLHLPAHTISKPKFQSRPNQDQEEETLQLYTMLVCASAMQKGELLEKAKRRALSEEVPFRKETDGTPPQMDENDPDRPLNGGPVTICPGCIVRERKRAARKKTKKPEEEEEWAKDEAKRVIVFNCPENREWLVEGTKDVARKDHESPTSTLYVTAPMRIACYCRHQNEKVGFRVIFTIKDHTQRVIAQAVSHTIMITDDHKQPTQAPGPSGSLYPPVPENLQQMPSYPMQYQMQPTFQQNMPFRTSFSTSDLSKFNAPQSQYPNIPNLSQQPGMPAYERQSAYSNHRSNGSTASATPRNLSRPASPTDPSGHSTKKRRSGGITKVPSGLTMTRLDTQNAATTGSGGATTPLSTGPPNNAYSFASPVAPTFGYGYEAAAPSSAMSSGFQSGPSTPGPMSSYGSPGAMEAADQYQYFSAPTSQHASRAPSPNPQLRLSQGPPNFGPAGGIPQAAAGALNNLPAGLNIQRPPQIQKVLPEQGSRAGGAEVTLLGSGFTQSLEVMFGDTLSPKVTWWAETTIVAVTPPAARPGPVEVCFRHQHRTAPTVNQQIQGLLPTRRVFYNYQASEQDQNQARMQQLNAGILQGQPGGAHGGIDPSQLNQGGMVLPMNGNQYAQFMGGAQHGSMPRR